MGEAAGGLLVMPRMHAVLAAMFAMSVLVMTASGAEPPVEKPLPDPLNLKQALELTGTDHPDLELAASRIDSRKARLAQCEAENGFDLSLRLVGQAVDPVSSSGFVDDSQARILLSKRLYDFGQTGNRMDACRERLESEWSHYFDARQQQQLKIMSLFFDVILADLHYRVTNEEMAHTYVQYDKIRERHKLGQYSDIDLKRYESIYQVALSKRVQAQSQQRAARARLAIGMNRPDELVDKLTLPILDYLDQELPDYDDQVKKVLASNPVLIAKQHDLASAEKLVRSAGATGRPELTAELEAAQYQRPIGALNDARASLVMKWPIYQGGLRRAKLAAADAGLRERRAYYRQAEMQLRQKTLELLQRIELLQYKRKQAKVYLEYKDLALDQSRALYELEASISLGEAMIGVTEAQWKAAKVDFELALAWAELKALTGELVEKTAEEKYR